MSAVDTSEPRMKAAIDMVRRCGARQFQIRYSDDEEPTVWLSVATFGVNENGRPIAQGGETRHEVASALDPLGAMLRLCEQLVDGAMCTHCGRPAGLEPERIEHPQTGGVICWYVYDPELQLFRRSCESTAEVRVRIGGDDLAIDGLKF